MPDTTTDWIFPFDAVIEHHRTRIPDHEDQVPGVVEVWRAGDTYPVWSVLIGNSGDIPPRDAALFAARVMTTMTGADYTVLSVDTHVTALTTNPNTGEPWKAGEMQAMCDQDGFCETGQMQDNLLILAARRDGKLRMQGIPYHFHKGEVMYYDLTPPLDEWEESSAGEMRGRIPETMRAIMAMPPISERLNELGAYEEFELPDDEAAIHQIMAGVRVMSEAARNNGTPGMYAHAIPTTSPEMAAIVERSTRENMPDVNVIVV